MRIFYTLKQAMQMLASMSAAIYLLIIIGVISALGTFIPQGQLSSFYLEHYGPLLGHLIILLSLHKLYQAWWFVLIIGLLCLSIMLCACQRLHRVKKLLTLASLIMHLAVVLIVIGAAWSLGYAHSASVEIPEGETISLSEYGFDQGQLTLNQFTIEYYPDFQPRQYCSDLNLRDYKGQDYQQQIYVNHPLKTGSLKVYQSSWGWMIKLGHNGETAQFIALKDRDSLSIDPSQGLGLQAIFIPDFDENGHGVKTRSPLPQNPHVWLALVQKGLIVDMKVVPLGQQVDIGGYQFSFDDFSYYSGVLIKQDPGVYLVFAGFILMLLAMLTRYAPTFLTRKAD